MTTTLALITLTLGQVAYSTAITVDTISDPSGWLTARDWLHAGESFKIDSYVWFDYPPGCISGSAEISHDGRRWLTGSELCVSDGLDVAGYVGDQIANAHVDFATGRAQILLGWDGIKDPFLPQYDDAEIIGHVAPRVPLIPGDSTRDGLFDSSDLIAVFIAGHYETGERIATWDTGDWDLNGWFRSDDLILALQTGAYERPAEARAIPEPSAVLLVLCASLLALGKVDPVRRIKG